MRFEDVLLYLFPLSTYDYPLFYPILDILSSYIILFTYPFHFPAHISPLYSSFTPIVLTACCGIAALQSGSGHSSSSLWRGSI